MKILFAGGGTGGHFYPIIAIAEEVNKLIDTTHLVGIDMYFMSDSPIDLELLKKTGITYIEVPAGKRRTYASIQNYLDIFKTLYGCIIATWKIFFLYPDVVFGKGGYASFPAMFAAKLLRVPVVIHESDTVPGKVNKYISQHAQKIAISYPEATQFFPKGKGMQEKMALTGQPVRKTLLEMPPEDPYEVFHLEANIPIVLVLGGSQGSENINENLIDIMPRLVQKYQVIHQTGEGNYEWMKKRAAGALAGIEHAERYHPFGFLEVKQLRIAAKGASLVVSRAGSTIFEISLWQKPSILIPLAIARDDHQRKNAYSYSRSGGALVVEEQNLKPEIFFNAVAGIMDDEARQQVMIEGTKQFAKVDAAEKIAQLLLSISTHHE